MRLRMVLLFAALLFLTRAAGAQSVSDTVGKVNASIARSDRLKYSITAAMLRHWRGASGTPVSLPESAFVKQPGVLSALAATHRAAFIAAAAARLRSGELAPGTPATLSTSSTTRGSGDLFYAIGEFTLTSQVQVSVTQLNTRQYRMTFTSWQVSLSDRFAFNAAQRYTFPPNVLTGSELLAVEAAGLAAPFDITSATANVTATNVLRSAVIAP